MDIFKKAREYTSQRLDWEWLIMTAVVGVALSYEAYKVAIVFIFLAVTYYLKCIVELLFNQKLLKEKEALESKSRKNPN